jgi:predicted ATPase
VQSLVETHSEYLVVRLQTLIAERRIKPEDVAVYWVEVTSGGKEIRQLEINERGAFVDDWPRGFFPERLKEAKRLVQARRVQEEG